jgi:hypothetical protein
MRIAMCLKSESVVKCAEVLSASSSWARRHAYPSRLVREGARPSTPPEPNPGGATT